MLVDASTLRISALAIWLDLAEDSRTQNRIANELWCLRNNVDITTLSDVELVQESTAEVIEKIMTESFRSRDETAALLLCTMLEV